jgi:hypothetical protein
VVEQDLAVRGPPVAGVRPAPIAGRQRRRTSITVTPRATAPARDRLGILLLSTIAGTKHGDGLAGYIFREYLRFEMSGRR